MVYIPAKTNYQYISVFFLLFSDQIYCARGEDPMLHITATGIGRVRASL